ncbi:MAG: DNA-binding protein [Natrialbaceae archaeon]|nr:DNA-binding protein [Natrialbaceae archaeon]
MSGGSDPNDLLSAISEAEAAFAEIGSSISPREDEIAGGNHWKTQLTKACRLLSAATLLRRENGHFTAQIELCFGATERSIEAFLLRMGGHDLQDFRDHTLCYNRAHEAGLFERTTAEKLLALYADNRTESYYGGRRPTEAQADAMVNVAGNVHRFAASQIREGSVCVCSN